jgi:hypothetical protein
LASLTPIRQQREQINAPLAWSGPATPLVETITPNSSTPYIVAYTDLKREPVVPI